MIKKQQVRCPNCGSMAERLYFAGSGVMQTECPSCDYLLVSCTQTGKVFESYAPGIGLSAHLQSVAKSKSLVP
ncbi:MAG: hypothetical protein N5P05_002295 [Chroococcopsis gigantea SAG 12.99]|jgi:endogenous inhibitor of DNA gyrase (YacG/DUF329 family)|nr:replication restart DNA helicase PriA [Chlorogloea purpurea SAG 13.99]MDV3000689.1 hypothetical protein [Chroococcopsis gigantea SAG 12.99]